jgi:putative transcription factor
MTVCELCGKDTELFRAKVEGSELNVCAACGKYGKILQKPVMHTAKSSQIQKAAEPSEVVVSDYAQRIRSAREKSGMTQKEFALKLNEKESIIHKLESDLFVPPIDLAKKLERLLRIKLVEIEEEEEAEAAKKSSGPLTIGDIINLKK